MKELHTFIENMRSTSSANDKIEIIKNSGTFIHKVLEYTYNPFKQYYVTSKTCVKNSQLVNEDIAYLGLELFNVLDQLNTRKVTGHDAITLVNSFVASCQSNGELIYKL